MSENIRDGLCKYECRSTWRYDYGPDRSLPGTHGNRGDVRRCPHGRLWRWIGIRQSIFFTEHDQWERIYRWWTPIDYRRATKVLTAVSSVVSTEEQP